jgi:adenosylcobinamide kinase/adenosylcobinamide-phosphate guanylyltransferase
MKTLILGGVRSGKSRLAEVLATRSAKPVTYIATATAGDGEMRARIEAHRARRAPEWTVVEEPIRLAGALEKHGANGAFVLVDCLTLWLTNLLVAGDEAKLTHERDALISILPTLSSEIVLVSNETGMGIMPLGELSRRFGDEAGRLHQELAQICDRVVLTVAGLPSLLKGELF